MGIKKTRKKETIKEKEREILILFLCIIVIILILWGLGLISDEQLLILIRYIEKLLI